MTDPLATDLPAGDRLATDLPAGDRLATDLPAGDRLATDPYTDPAFVDDPFPFYERVRALGRAVPDPGFGAFLVSGYDDVVAIYNDTDRYSSVNSMAGPFSGFPGPQEGIDDVGALIDELRPSLPMHEHLPMMDPPVHADHRGLLMRLITPKRLRENEEFMHRLAEQQMDVLLAVPEPDFIHWFSEPFSNMVVADLLGVPEEDRDVFRAEQHEKGAPNPMQEGPLDALAYLYDRFTAYVEDRRREPRDDVLTGLATATFPDGSLPDVVEVARIASFLFTAGGETSARVLAAAARFLAEDPDLQDEMRSDPSGLANLVEEVLRMEGPVKLDHRIAKVPVCVGGVDIPAGATVGMLLGAANRDPAKFGCPADFDPARPEARQHIAFGHGVHTCPGAPLARAEIRIALEHLLARTRRISISATHHGPVGAHRFEFSPTFVLRGLQTLHLDLEPA